MELICAEVREAAAEFALGILPQPDRSLVAAHLLRCRACRGEIAALGEVASRLLNVVPGTEPPLGFDRAVMARVTPPWRGRRVTWAVLAAVAACALLVGVALQVVGGSPHAARTTSEVAVLRDGGVAVGSVMAGGQPLWVSVTVRGVAVSGPIACQVVSRRGAVQTLGLFDLVGGSGSWAAPDPAGIRGDRLARLVDSRGRVIATATLH
jgi:predicted anti-sigma-YlaC factor YlaD